jgi:hypothetical protein
VRDLTQEQKHNKNTTKTKAKTKAKTTAKADPSPPYPIAQERDWGPSHPVDNDLSMGTPKTCGFSG